jgi:hypothetical protein
VFTDTGATEGCAADSRLVNGLLAGTLDLDLDFRTFTSTTRKPGELRTLPDRRPPEL